MRVAGAGSRHLLVAQDPVGPTSSRIPCGGRVAFFNFTTLSNSGWKPALAAARDGAIHPFFRAPFACGHL